MALQQRRIEILRFAPIDLDPDEVLARIANALVAKNATRVVFDSLTELKRAVPRGRKHTVLAALLEWLRARQVTALLLLEPHRLSGSRLDFAHSPLERMAENVLLMRNAELKGTLRRSLSIVKMRDTEHDHAARPYSLSTGGLRLGQGTSAAVGEEDA